LRERAKALLHFGFPHRFGVLLLVTAHFALGSGAGQCFPAHEIVANNPLKSRVIGSNLNGILSFGFTCRWTIAVYRSDWRRLRRGKHLPFSHINRVVPDPAARFIP